MQHPLRESSIWNYIKRKFVVVWQTPYRISCVSLFQVVDAVTESPIFNSSNVMNHVKCRILYWTATLLLLKFCIGSNRILNLHLFQVVVDMTESSIFNSLKMKNLVLWQNPLMNLDFSLLSCSFFEWILNLQQYQDEDYRNVIESSTEQRYFFSCKLYLLLTESSNFSSINMKIVVERQNPPKNLDISSLAGYSSFERIFNLQHKQD